MFFWHRFLPKDLRIIGYARSKLTDQDLKEKVKGYLKGTDAEVKEFLSRISYIPGSYDGDEGFQVSLYEHAQRVLDNAVQLCSGAVLSAVGELGKYGD